MSRDGHIDYSKYNETELMEALGTIDRLNFPVNYANLTERLRFVRAEKPKSRVESGGPPALIAVYETAEYRPNIVPVVTRIAHSASALCLLAYGVFGLLLGDIYVPGRATEGMHFHGSAAVAMFCAMLAAIAILVSTVIDHYDKRPNERGYGRFAKRAEFVAWTFFVFAGIVEIFLNRKP
jgi:hypothetical protein